MIKNIPNKYDLELILEEINVNHKGKFDFFYLPIDPRVFLSFNCCLIFKNKCNVGYAFVNFIDRNYIIDFYNEFNNTKWKRFNSEKICDIKYARIQGKKALMYHFQYSNVMNQQVIFISNKFFKFTRIKILNLIFLLNTSFLATRRLKTSLQNKE